MTKATLRVEAWGDRFVVIGEFEGHSEISPIRFSNYGDALRELARIIGREVIRHESYPNRNSNR